MMNNIIAWAFGVGCGLIIAMIIYVCTNDDTS